MDIATVIGLVATLGLIFYAMADAAGIGAFIEINSIVIVFGGSIAVLLMRSTLPDFINAWAKVLMKTIKSYQKVKNFRESTLQKPTKPYKNLRVKRASGRYPTKPDVCFRGHL